MRELSVNMILSLCLVSVMCALAWPQILQLQQNDRNLNTMGFLGRGLKQVLQKFEDVNGGAFEFETVIRGDQRKLVENTQVFPFTSVVQITRTCPTFDGARGICSGTIIGPNAVLTAGHCVYERSSGGRGFCGDFVVTPALNGLLSPFGSVGVTKMSVPDNWVNGIAPNHTNSDYGILILDEDIGFKTGWMGVSLDCEKTTYDDMVIAGYPGDKKNGFNGNSMFYSSCSGQMNACANNASDGYFEHECDTSGGMSGSPIWVLDETNTRVIRAVHSSGTKDVEANPFNRAAYISVEGYYWIQQQISTS